ncbi:hypothetical protein Hanom_Chr01g00001331 [Helianthus anomalus]
MAIAQLLVFVIVEFNMEKSTMHIIFLYMVFSNLIIAMAGPEQVCKKYGNDVCGYSLNHAPDPCTENQCLEDCLHIVPDEQRPIASFCRDSFCICCSVGLGCPNI